MKKRTENMIKLLKTMFPGVQGIQNWGASEGSIHLGDAAEGGEICNIPAADYYAADRPPYNNGVHRRLVDTLELYHYHYEWYDSGTLIAFPSADFSS